MNVIVRDHSRRTTTWRGLGGHTFDAPIGASEAIAAVGLDFQVRTLPIGFFAPIGDVAKSGWTEIPGRKAIVREPTPRDPQWKNFGWAGDGYTIVQNTDIAAALDPLTELWPVDTAGELDDGRTLFVVLDAGDYDVGGPGGDQVQRRFLVTDTKDGGTSLKFASILHRVICKNTLLSALASAIVRARILHTATAKKKFEFRMGLVQKLQSAQAQNLAAFDAMAKQALTEDQAVEFFEAVYPYPEAGEQASLAEELFSQKVELETSVVAQMANAKNGVVVAAERTDVLRTQALRLFDEFGGTSRLGGTAWAAYNAVVELEDHRQGQGKTEEQDAAKSAIFGSRAHRKEQAFALAAKL